LAGIHAFVCDEGFGTEFVAVRITETDFGERSSTTWIVDDFFDDAAEVTMSFGILIF
jgi:hypothetical protein